MKKFLFNITILVLPFAFFTAAINLYVDPAKIFSTGKFENKIASIILKGHNVDRLRNFNQRITLKDIVSQLPSKPDICAIGTSRMFEMSSDFFPDKRFLNCSMSHSNLRDYVAVIGLLDSCNKLPDEIYIDTSPMISIISEADSDEWESIYEYYFAGLSRLKIDFDASEKSGLPLHLFKKKITNLFSFSYFQKSFASISKIKQNVIQDVGKDEPKNFGRMSDFSVRFPDNHYKSDTLKATADALFFVKNTTTPTVNYSGIDKLKRIISFLNEKKVKVTLVNIPFQIDFFKQYNSKNTFFSDLQNELKKIAIDYNVKVLGTFNPEVANINRGQFFDHSHCNKDALKKVLEITQQ